MTAPKTVLIGDRVRFESAAGTIRGEVIQILDRTCADGVVRPWIFIKYIRNNREHVTYLSDASLAMMKFKVIFRDCTNYEALAQRYAHERMMEA